jgi:hypothetical protein
VWTRTLVVVPTVLLAVCCRAGEPVVRLIDHHAVAQAANLSQPALDAIAQQKWLFLHASLGMNSLGRQGLDRLHAEDAKRWPLRRQLVNPAFGPSPEPPPAATTPGTVYHWPRGETDWRGKLRMLDDAVRTKGWHAPAVDIVFHKFCFIDMRAEAQPYLDALTRLERDFPTTTFIYATTPLLRIDRDDQPGWRAENAQTNAFNRAVRDHCRAGNRFLLDIADLEAHDPEGTELTYEQGGQACQALFPGYAAQRSNYLNPAGARQVVLAWYVLAGEVAKARAGAG